MGAGNTYTATLSGTVTVGNNSDPAGVILNVITNTAGDTITGGTLAFGAAEGIIYSFDSTATTVGTGNVVNSSITGTGGVTAAGTSNLTLGGAFSVSSLNLNNINNSLSGSATLFISGAITGTGNLTVTSNGSNVTNISSAISNTGNLVFTQNGSSSLSLSAGSNAVNNTGTITFNGNTTANPAFANGAIGPNVTQIIQDDPNDTLSIGLETGTGEDAYSVTILAGEVNNAASAWGTGAITLGAPNGSANAMLYDNGATINNAINVGASTGTMTINGHGSTGNLNVFNGLVTLSSASSILTVTGNNQSITFSGGTTGPGNILVQTYNSNGTFFTTNAVNNGGYIEDAGPASGPLTISGGVGSSVTELIENSATSAFSVTTTALTVNSSGTTLVNNATAGATTLTVSSTISGSGNLTLDNDTSTNGAIVIPNSASLLTYSGSLINNGTGTGSETVLNLGASITGVAQDSNTSPFTVGQMSAAGNVNLIENGTAALNFTNGNNTGTITASGSGTGTITLGSLASTVTALTVNSAGGATLVVQGNNTTFAPTSNIVTVTSGALDAHPTTSTASALNTATVDLGAGSGSATAIFETDQSAAGIANLVSVGNNSGTNEISNTNNIGAAFSGAVTLNGGNGVTFVSTGTTGTTAETGGIAGTGNVTLDPNGSAAIGITVSGSNDVNNTGAVIDNGTGASAALITANIDSTVNAITENSATSPFNITTGIITVNSSGTTLTDNAASGTAGVLTVSAAITGAGNLTLDNNSAINNGIALSSNNVGNTGRVINNGTGTGTETLTGLGAAVTGVTQSSATSRLIMQGTYSYTGTTQVTAGVLDVTGTLAAGTATSVSSGATLEGTGTLRGSVVVASGGYLAPGTGGAGTTGTLATGTTDITSANLTFALNSTTSASDLLAVSGNLTLGGANLLASDLGSTALSPGTVFTVASYTGTLSGTFAGLVNGSNIVIGVNTYQINYGSLSNSDITLDTVNAVPEPSTWAMLIGGLVVLLIHVRLRRPRVLAETE